MIESTRLHPQDTARWRAWIVALRTHGAGQDESPPARSAADSSLVVTLARLDEFRGVSRFTSWASKFALREARKTATAASANGTHETEGHLNG